METTLVERSGGSGALSPRLQAAHRTAEEFLRAAKAENTRRAYRAAWEAFLGWCEATEQRSLPASPDVLVLYLSELAGRGRHPSTIHQALSAIRAAHEAAGYRPSPTVDPLVREAMRGVRRRLGVAPYRQVDALLTDSLRLMLTTCVGVTGERDRALLLLGFGAALRRSELVALDVEDVRVEQGLRVRIRRSKTDQEGRSAEEGIVAGQRADLDPVEAFLAWREVLRADTGPLFRPIDRWDNIQDRRLLSGSVAQIIQRRAILAGLPGDYAGHSLRAGFATQAAMNRAPEMAIMQHGRWRKLETVSRYIRKGTIWHDNASAYLGL